jgi:uncharacterized MAPEG superfamily protein
VDRLLSVCFQNRKGGSGRESLLWQSQSVSGHSVSLEMGRVTSSAAGKLLPGVPDGVRVHCRLLNHPLEIVDRQRRPRCPSMHAKRDYLHVARCVCTPLTRKRTSRIGRCHRNDLENLTLFAIVSALFIAPGGGTIAAPIHCIGFAAARAVHTVAYRAARPLLRRNAYTVGFMSIFSLSIHCIVLVFAT